MEDFKIIPNPNRGIFRIESELAFSSFTIYDTQGKLVHRQDDGNREVQMNQRLDHSGLFIIEVLLEDQAIHKKIFILQK
jgi:hypothetical protein